MRNPTRNLLYLFIFVVIAVGLLLAREGKFSDKSQVLTTQEAKQETMGDPASAFDKAQSPASKLADDSSATSSPEEKKKYQQTLLALALCLQFKIKPAEDLPMSADAFLRYLQDELGPATSLDRSMVWGFQTKDGQQRQLRLEVSEDDAGVVGRELQYFAVDRQGQFIPIALNDIPTHNPSDETINKFLKEGDVFFREHSAAAFFPEGEKLEYKDHNSKLSELELIKGEMAFRCANLQSLTDECKCERP